MWNPTVGWLPSSSYVQPVAPPTVEPDATPGVSVCVSKTWLPYIIGSLNQLIQPTTWDTDDPAVLQTALERATKLQAMFGSAEGCMQIRWHDGNCSLQISTDGGATWENVDGWPDPGPPDCLHPELRIDAGGNLQITYDGGTTWTTIDGWPPPTPPNPSGAGTAQAACNVATHLAQDIIQGALASAVNSFDGSLSAAVAASSIIALIPGFGPEVALTIDAAVGIVYLIYTTGSIGDYRAASTDPLLAHDLQCAIYNAISADGAVTASNYAAVVAAIAAIGYAPSDVQTAVNSFVTSLGLNGMLAAQQLGGLVAGDCSGCITEGVAVFNGTDDDLRATIDLGAYGAAFTICMWIQNIFTNNGDFHQWIDGYTNSNTPGQPSLWYQDSSGGAQPHWEYRSSATTRGEIYGNNPIPNSAWHHLAFVYHSGAWTSPSLEIFIDGVSQGITGVGGHGPDITPDTFTTVGINAPLAAPPGTQPFSGKMADLRYYNGTALTATQLSDIHAAGVTGHLPVGSPTHWYKLDEGSGSTANDSGSSPAPLTWHGSGAHWGTV